MMPPELRYVLAVSASPIRRAVASAFASPVSRLSWTSALISTPWLYVQVTSPLLRQVLRLTPSLTRFEPFTMPVPWNQDQPAWARWRYAASPVRCASAALSWM
jgi:hypothetical protein